MALDHSRRPAIRGQLEGPISIGFNVLNQDERPILFDDTVRPFMLAFMARRLNVQLEGLKKSNTYAFMFVDEPGLQFLFSAMAGCSDVQAKQNLDRFFSMVDRPRGIHLFGNPYWNFLLGPDLDVLSLDICTNAEIFSSCARSIRRFIDRSGIIIWGIVPTGAEAFEKENLDSLTRQLENVWTVLSRKGIDTEELLRRCMLSPATGCLVNPDREKTVEKAFESVRRRSRQLREKHKLS